MSYVWLLLQSYENKVNGKRIWTIKASLWTFVFFFSYLCSMKDLDNFAFSVLFLFMRADTRCC